MSVVVVATITPVPGHEDAVREVLLDTIPLVHAEDGCELYALHQGSDRFVMIEQWTSAQALAVHSGGAALAAMGPRLAGHVTGPADVQVLQAVPAGDATKGQVVGQ